MKLINIKIKIQSVPRSKPIPSC